MANSHYNDGKMDGEVASKFNQALCSKDPQSDPVFQARLWGISISDCVIGIRCVASFELIDKVAKNVRENTIRLFVRGFGGTDQWTFA